MAAGVPRQIPAALLQPAVEPHICVRCCKARPRVGPCTKENRSVNCTYCGRWGNECCAVRCAAAPYHWVFADVSSQIPEALWPRARGAICIYNEGRDARAGTSQYKHAQEVAYAFNRRILGYDRELRRHYPGSRAKLLAKKQLEQHKLSNAIALAQVSFPYSWLTSLVLTICRLALSFLTFLNGVLSMTMPSTMTKTCLRVFHV